MSCSKQKYRINPGHSKQIVQLLPQIITIRKPWSWCSIFLINIWHWLLLPALWFTFYAVAMLCLSCSFYHYTSSVFSAPHWKNICSNTIHNIMLCCTSPCPVYTLRSHQRLVLAGSDEIGDRFSCGFSFETPVTMCLCLGHLDITYLKNFL